MVVKVLLKCVMYANFSFTCVHNTHAASASVPTLLPPVKSNFRSFLLHSKALTDKNFPHEKARNPANFCAPEFCELHSERTTLCRSLPTGRPGVLGPARCSKECKVQDTHTRSGRAAGDYSCIVFVRFLSLRFNPFTPESDQCQISPAASPEILHHTVRRTWLFIAYSDEKWL